MQKFSHVVVLPSGDNIALRLTCDEDFLVVGFDACMRSDFAGAQLGQGGPFASGPVTLQPRAWRPAYLLDGSGLPDSLSSSRVLDGRGVAVGGFDGVEYAQFARAGESLVLHALDRTFLPASFIFILTYSAATPRCVVEDFSGLL